VKMTMAYVFASVTSISVVDMTIEVAERKTFEICER